MRTDPVLSARTLVAACSSISWAAAASLLVACHPAAPAETPAEPVSEAAPAEPAAATGAQACAGELVAADDGMIEDFEDGNNQVSASAGRDGYWWTANDDKGTEIEVPTGTFAPESGGADSASAAHLKGKTAAGPDAWGAEVGANLVNGSGAVYDASKYAGIRFKAKANGETTKVRLSLSDVNTHQDTGVCKQCWNHFRKDFSLTEEWAEYAVSFADMQQRQGWGDPRPPSVEPGKLVGVSFAVDGGKAFDVWVDDIEFLVCKTEG